MPVTQEFDDRLEIDSFTDVMSWTKTIRDQFGRKIFNYVAEEQDRRNLGESVRITISVESLNKARAMEEIKGEKKPDIPTPNWMEE